MWKIAKEKVSLCVVPDTMKVFEPSGTVIPEEDAESGLETVWEFIEQAFKYSNEGCLKISPTLNLEDFFNEKLAEGTLSREQRSRVLLLAEMWGSFIGDSWKRQSLRWFWLEECLEGENLYVMENHAPIIQHVAAKTLTHADVHLSTKVTSIESAGTDPKDPKVIVRTETETFEFDEVVVAVPLGCLKRSQPAFSPPLPPRIQAAVRNASYSSLEKVYITFPVAFWDGPPSAPSSDEDSVFPSFAHFLNPEYVPPAQQHWSIEMLPLSSPTVFGPHAKPTLLIYTHNPCAEHVTSLIRGISPDSPEYCAALNTFFKPYYSRLPHFIEDSPDCTPTALLATDWHGDDLAGNGSYTNFQVSESAEAGEEVRLDEDVRAMRAGVPERGVWLAGEHTAPFVGLGTTTGAYWSGESAGLRVLAANGLTEGVEAVELAEGVGQ